MRLFDAWTRIPPPKMHVPVGTSYACAELSSKSRIHTTSTGKVTSSHSRSSGRVQGGSTFGGQAVVYGYDVILSPGQIFAAGVSAVPSVSRHGLGGMQKVVLFGGHGAQASTVSIWLVGF